MSTTQDTVADRLARARTNLTPAQIALGLVGVTLALFLLAFAQHPLVHDAMHNGRHVTGVVCH